MNKYIFICLYIESLNFIGLLFSLEADKIFLETEIVRAQLAFLANSKDIDIFFDEFMFSFRLPAYCISLLMF